jgi:nucleotide-binding universal stress UspA family protein
MQDDPTQPQDRVLACVDQSRFADNVTDTAAWAAKRLGAPLEILHILDRHPEIATGNDHSGIIGFNAQQNLLTELSDQDETKARAAREQGRIFLNRLRERALGQGVESPDVRLRYGDLEEVLVEQQADVRLFVLGRRGSSAETTQRDLGRNLERVVRALKRPILAVTDAFTEPREILLAFDAGVVTRKGVEMIAASPLFRGLRVHLVMAGKPRRDAEQQLTWAKETLEAADIEAPTALIPGDTESSIAHYVKDQQIDMLAMGAFGHAPWRTLLFGSKTNDLLRAAKIPALLLR